jgi:arginyl-tRNA synthetase
LSLSIVFENVQRLIGAVIVSAIPDLSEEDLSFRRLDDASRGDLALEVFAAARKLRLKPPELAAKIAALQLPDTLLSCEAKGPYVNFRFDRPKFCEQLFTVSVDPRYGSSRVGDGKSILFEHTSINPNASPHLGRARNALLGDSLTRLLRFEGYHVDVHYYVNDMGKQIALLALECRGLARLPVFDDMLLLYVKANERAGADPAFEAEGMELLRRFEAKDPDVVFEFKQLVDACLAGQLATLQRLGCNYDVFDRESDFLIDERLEKLMQKLKSDGALFVDEQGREVVDLGKLGHKDEAGRYLVLRRANGSSLYAYRDIAYTMHKLDRAPGRNLLVLGEDHKLYLEQLTRVLAVAGYEPPEVVHYSYIVLRDGKMSTRKGTVVLLSDFLDEAARRARMIVDEASGELPESERVTIAEKIAVGTVRFAILRVHPNKNVVFDWESALTFTGDSGPYIQYSCARIASILRKLDGELPTVETVRGYEPHALEWDLALSLAEMQRRVSGAAAKRDPGIVAEYALDVAKAFSGFYRECPVLRAETAEARTFRIYLCRSTHRVLTRCLELLGMEAPERM